MSLATYQKGVEHLGESQGVKNHDHDMIHDFRISFSQLVIASLICFPVSFLVAAPKAYAQDYYGAIASSGTASGVGRHSTLRGAQKMALQACNNYSRSGGCKIRLLVHNECGAIAQNYSNGAEGIAKGNDPLTAQRSALATCSESGPGCKVIWVCGNPR